MQEFESLHYYNGVSKIALLGKCIPGMTKPRFLSKKPKQNLHFMSL